MKPIIAPSILSADFGYLAKDIEMVIWLSGTEICGEVKPETAGCAFDDCESGKVYSGGKSVGRPYDECAL